MEGSRAVDHTDRGTTQGQPCYTANSLAAFSQHRILLLGIGLLAINLQVLLEFVQKDVLMQISSLQSGSYRVTGFITGLGMTVGGMVVLWKAFSVIFPE